MSVIGTKFEDVTPSSMGGLTVEQVNDLCNAIKNCYRTIGGKLDDADLRDAFSKVLPMVDSLRDLALAALSERGGLVTWIDGAPPHPYDKEWFIALTDRDDKVVLRALPKENAYDYKTADETYFTASRIKCWMQFPDSQFVPYTCPQAGQVTFSETDQRESGTSADVAGGQAVNGGNSSLAQQRHPDSVATTCSTPTRTEQNAAQEVGRCTGAGSNHCTAPPAAAPSEFMMVPREFVEAVAGIEMIEHINNNGPDYRQCPVCYTEQVGKGNLYGTPAWRADKDMEHADDCLIVKARAMLSAPPCPDAGLVEGKKLWLWQNFVDGNPEYWAFDNPFPAYKDGDPKTVGSPCGYAIFKSSRAGRSDVSAERVIDEIKLSIRSALRGGRHD